MYRTYEGGGEKDKKREFLKGYVADRRVVAAGGGGGGGGGVESIRVFFSSASPLVLIARCKSEMAVQRDSVRGNRGVSG